MLLCDQPDISEFDLEALDHWYQEFIRRSIVPDPRDIIFDEPSPAYPSTELSWKDVKKEEIKFLPPLDFTQEWRIALEQCRLELKRNKKRQRDRYRIAWNKCFDEFSNWKLKRLLYREMPYCPDDTRRYKQKLSLKAADDRQYDNAVETARRKIKEINERSS